uniref:Uncharacterized protein n=1 Tax=Rhizophora mucronata TaxID=61149 RepID=A0A2P2PEW1_RHIMU
MLFWFSSLELSLKHEFMHVVLSLSFGMKYSMFIFLLFF